MTILNRIDEHLTENFAKGKDAQYLAGYLVTLFKKKAKEMETAARVDNYGHANSIVSSAMSDLQKIKARLDQIAMGK